MELHVARFLAVDDKFELLFTVPSTEICQKVVEK